MAEYVLKYADPRGEIHHQVAEAVGKGTARALHATRIPDLFHQAAPRDRRRDRGRRPQEEDQFREISDLQPAIRHAGARRFADFEGAGSAVGAPDRRQTRAPYQSGPRRGEERLAALGRLCAAGRVSADLRHLSAGGREERRARRGAGPVHHLPETGAGGSQEADPIAGLSLPADRAGDLPHGVPGDLRGPQVRRTVSQHVREIAGRNADSDRGGHHGAQLHSGRLSGPDRRGDRVSFLGEDRYGRREGGPLAAAHAADRRDLDQIPSGAVCPRAGHAAGGWHSAAAGARYGLEFARNPAVEEDSWPRPARW